MWSQRVSVVLILVAGCLRAQVTPNVGYTTLTLANTTGSGSPSLPIRAHYPSTGMGLNAPFDASGAPYPVIVWLHGACSTAGLYGLLADYWADAGYVVILEDSSGCDPDLQVNDAVALHQVLESEATTPSSPLFGWIDMNRAGLSGHSMGGGNLVRILAQDPGYVTGVGYGTWDGGVPVSWSTLAPQVHRPVAFVHGLGDVNQLWQSGPLPMLNGLGTCDSFHMLYLLNGAADHFNPILPYWNWPGTATDFDIFFRSMEISTAWFDRHLKGESAELEKILGEPATLDSYRDSVHLRIDRPELWVTPAHINQDAHARMLGTPGAAGTIYASTSTFLIDTTMGLFELSPWFLLPLWLDVGDADGLHSLLASFPNDPTMIGTTIHLQGLTLNRFGALRFTPLRTFTIGP